MKTIERINILNGIASKGGLLGTCASFYLNDETMGHQFIMECSEQCHIEFTSEYLGKELVSDIIEYSKLKRNVNN
jgi:hypothetical protein